MPEPENSSTTGQDKPYVMSAVEINFQNMADDVRERAAKKDKVRQAVMLVSAALTLVALAVVTVVKYIPNTSEVGAVCTVNAKDSYRGFRGAFVTQIDMTCDGKAVTAQTRDAWFLGRFDSMARYGSLQIGHKYTIDRMIGGGGWPLANILDVSPVPAG